jgi:hypothetical protein
MQLDAVIALPTAKSALLGQLNRLAEQFVARVAEQALRMRVPTRRLTVSITTGSSH